MITDNPDSSVKGLFPNVFNLASGAIITVNATCGETGAEVYCKIAEHVYERYDYINISYSIFLYDFHNKFTAE